MVVGKLVANLSHFDYLPSLRCDFDYIKYMRDEFPKDFTFKDGEKLRFRDFIVSIRNGENVKKAYYSLTPTPYKYLSVSNVQNRNIIWDDISHLTEEKGKELENRKLEKGSIIVTRSGSVGRVALFSEADRTVIPSGYLIIISVDEFKVKPRFVLNYLASSRVQKYFTILSIGKDQENISQADVRSLPFPSLSLDKQSEILDEVNPLERKINTLAGKIEPLQEVIDRVFLEHKIKISDKEKESRYFQTHLSDIGERKFFRCGPKYRSFWDEDKGFLFGKNNSKFQVVRLLDMMRVADTENLKKGILDKERILIGLEDIEPYFGRIVNKSKKVTEIGSAKVVFGESDILVSKLRFYLGKVILNEKSENLIGTTELVPFTIKKSVVKPEYIRYLLLSKEALQSSIALMYGKEHPRIHHLDILDIKVPRPSLSKQEEIVEEIEEKEERNIQIQKKTDQLQEELDNKFWSMLTE